jgi:hypothetical protein
MNHPTPIRLHKETDDDRANYYNKEAANARRAEIEHQMNAYLADGGEITVPPSYDSLQGASVTDQVIYGKKPGAAGSV